ncbi:MAG: class I SAM-dependent methyltransferase [Bacteroidales bacterium]
MKRSHPAGRLLVALSVAVLVTSGALWGQQVESPAKRAGQQAPGQKPFTPEVGQNGKDVVWVPTSETLVAKMLDMAQVTPQDVVMDLGSGDGRTVIAAAKRGARAIGIEYNPEMVELSKRNAAAAGVSDRTTFMKADLFETDLSQATVITMFLLPEINMKLRPKILELKPGTRVVSNSFTMEDWEPDETATVSDGCTNWCTALFWVVPAKVDGTWRFPGGELVVKQQFQNFTGTLSLPNGSHTITDGKLRGDVITFTVDGVVHTGKVNGSRMSGTVKGGGEWSASRK